MDSPEKLPAILTPREVARLFRVDPKTVTRWVNAGILPAFRTPGGHRRFHRDKILEILNRGKTNVVDR